MGQYQQWLQYREVDRLLHSQLEELTEELAQLRNREQLLQQMLHPLHVEQQVAGADISPPLLADNEILHALTASFNGHTYDTNSTNLPPATTTPGTTAMTYAQPLQSARQDEPTSAISQALYAQGSLPPVEDQFAHDAVATNGFQSERQMQFNRNSALPPIPHTPHSESTLLPDDIGAFIEEHTRTEPRMELPWWLRNAALVNANGPIDQESIRTNRLIQRWIERWGRHPGTPPSSGENGVQTAWRENEEGPST